MLRPLRRLLAFFPLLLATGLAAQPRKPNLIFILSDDLAMGDVGAYGQKLIQTPHLEQMGREGTRYLQA
jgi:arylsulfatase A-like enzyme